MAVAVSANPIMSNVSFGYARFSCPARMGITKDFAEVTFLKNTEVFKKYCEEWKPDILLVEIVEHRLLQPNKKLRLKKHIPHGNIH